MEMTNEKSSSLPSEIDKRSRLYFSNITNSLSFIFKSLLNIEVSPKKLYRKRLRSLPNDIIITIDFETDISGYFSFFLSLKTAFVICNILDPDLNNQYFDKEHLDMIGELGNLISGNTISRLENIDSNIEISTPYLSGFHKILTSEKLFWTFSCNFDIEIGHLGVLLSIKK